MFWAIILTLVLSWMAFIILQMRKVLKNKIIECKTLRTDNQYLSDKLNAQHNSDIERRVKNAYKRGLYDGRETDTLYRGLVAKYSKGEQATVMMNGRVETENEQRY